MNCLLIQGGPVKDVIEEKVAARLRGTTASQAQVDVGARPSEY